jgi:streptogramin lyase
MFGFIKGKKCGWRKSLPLLTCFFMVLALILPISVLDALAQTAATEGWYRLRTNSVPYQPQNVALDATGGLWVSASDGTEYAPGVWYRPPDALAGPSFQYFTNDRRNNLLSTAYNPPIEKPQLNATVLYAVRDKGGNTWYALKNRKVLCEKADGTWLTFTMPDSTSIEWGNVDTTNVDSAYRIRLIDNQDGTQDKLLIAIRGVVRVNAAFSVVETRQVYQVYNNYFIRDALIDSQGRTWVTSEMGVEKGTSLVNTTFVSTLFPPEQYPSAATGTMITRIVEDSLGNIWFGSDSYSGDGIYCYTTGGQWIKYADGLVNAIGKRVHDIAAGSDGSVWFGAVYSGAGGILRYVPEGGGQWTRYTMADLGLESGEIPSMAFDGTGLWFSTAYTPTVTGNGTGVHYLTLNAQGTPSVTHYTFRANSTSLTNLRFSYIAADRSGGVWFPAYDNPSIARLKSDGTWQQFREAGTQGLGSFGFAGVDADSKNLVYFAPTNAPPIAYDVAKEQWVNLPTASFTEYYYYGVYVDPQDGKWFHGAYFVYYLNPDNTAWTSFSSAAIPGFPASYYVNDVLVDDAGNAWFMCRYEIVLMKKDPNGGEPSWYRFTSGDASGYTGGYRVYQDDSGQIWNAAKQKFASQSNSWLAVAEDTGALDHRHLRFTNGRVPADMNLTSALSPINTLSALDERNMTLDSRGTVYFTGGLGNVNAGIVALGPLLGDIDGNGRVDLADAVLTAKLLAGLPSQASSNADINNDGKIGLAEMIFILQRVAGFR